MGLIEQLRRWLPSRFRPLGGELDRAIASVAVLIDDGPAFQARAGEMADRLGPAAIPGLRRRFHRPPPAPPGFTMRERGLTAWLSYWQIAIFEIVYHFRGQAVPMLRKVAFGEYDWTQANAIEILCRLAAEGVVRDRTIADLKRAMPKMWDEALLYPAATLRRLAENDPNVADVVAELRQVEAFDAAFREVDEVPGK